MPPASSPSPSPSPPSPSPPSPPPPSPPSSPPPPPPSSSSPSSPPSSPSSPPPPPSPSSLTSSPSLPPLTSSLTSSSSSSLHPLPPVAVLEDDWDVEQYIASGSYYDTFRARRKTDGGVNGRLRKNGVYALKLSRRAQSAVSDASVRRLERIADLIGPCHGVPQILHVQRNVVSVSKTVAHRGRRAPDASLSDSSGGGGGGGPSDATPRLLLVEEYVEGTDLFDYLYPHNGTNRTVPRPLQVGLCMQLLAIVSRLHRVGVVHRDIKTENVRLSRNLDRLYLLDLGLSVSYRVDGGEDASVGTSLAGSALTISPDLAKTWHQTDRALTVRDYLRSDVWACGLVMLTMCTGWCHVNRRLAYECSRETLPPDTVLWTISQLQQSTVEQTLAQLSSSIEPQARGMIEMALSVEPRCRPSATLLLDVHTAMSDRRRARSLESSVATGNGAPATVTGATAAHTRTKRTRADPRLKDSLTTLSTAVNRARGGGGANRGSGASGGGGGGGGGGGTRSPVTRSSRPSPSSLSPQEDDSDVRTRVSRATVTKSTGGAKVSMVSSNPLAAAIALVRRKSTSKSSPAAAPPVAAIEVKTTSRSQTNSNSSDEGSGCG